MIPAGVALSEIAEGDQLYRQVLNRLAKSPADLNDSISV
jgi:hypothetical protein